MPVPTCPNPYTPTILSPPNQSQVNQTAPVTLTWEPQGLVGSFNLQVATDATFTNLVVNTNNLFSGTCVLQNLSTNTQYFWRVGTVNQGGTSAWTSASSFTTVQPMLQITSPAGGVAWQRFQVVTISWLGNISGNVAGDLYLNGVLNRTFLTSTPTAPPGGSYSWTVALNQAVYPSTNYTIVIRTLASPVVSSPPSQPFTIFTNLTSESIVTKPAGLTITVDGTNYTAPANFSWVPTSTHTLATASPQVATDGQSASVFAAWSDGGAQSHSVQVPLASATNTITNTVTFSTNYLLDTAVTRPERARSQTTRSVPGITPGNWFR